VTGDIPTPSDAFVIRLAGIAAHAEELLAPDHPMWQAPVGLTTVKR
jgi:hypothetical protein